MNTLLAKILRPTSTATGRDPKGRTGTPRSRKAGRTGRRRMLALLAMPPLVTVLSLLGTGAAHASDEALVSGFGPTFSVGGFKYTTNWSADIACDATSGTMSVTVGIDPAVDGQSVYIQEWLYSYQTRQWSHVTYEQDGSHVRPGFQLTLGASLPAGWYKVHMMYGWYATTGWQAVPVDINVYQQYGNWLTASGAISDTYCYV